MSTNQKLLITPYGNPDLDGTACAFAYAEFLRKEGKDAVANIFGTPHREAQFVLDTFKIPSFVDAEAIVSDVDGIVIVDASDIRGLSGKIKPEQVVEIIDHRKINEASKFPNAKIQIELVGSAATLIAEKFYNSKTFISQEAAALLFSAIISNTINFQAKVTTERDHKMADWLRTKFPLLDNYVHEMFSFKSQFTKPLKETFSGDFATFDFNNYHLGIVQLEIIDVDGFINKNLVEIKMTLGELKTEGSFDLILLTCIDLEKAFNKFVAIDEQTERFVEQALKVNFDGGIAKREGIIMRKEIVPLMKEVLEAGKAS
jgi:manganese-dependent inorganic pyrophosphatase